jgi:O-antigen chain-terminating methyltransferase
VLFQLVEQAWRVLAPGGLLIFETPNPENVLVGSHTFYHDFSHRNPVTPTSLAFLVGYNGFDVTDMPRLSPYPEHDRVLVEGPLVDRFNGHFYGPQDYGMVARKPGGDE